MTDYRRHNDATWGDEGRSHSSGHGDNASKGDNVLWTPRERGGYWRQYSGAKSVTNRQRVTREPNGHGWASDSSRASGPATSSQPVTQASGKGTPSKSSGTSA